MDNLALEGTRAGVNGHMSGEIVMSAEALSTDFALIVLLEGLLLSMRWLLMLRRRSNGLRRGSRATAIADSKNVTVAVWSCCGGGDEDISARLI